MFLPFRINKSFLCSYMYVWNKVYMYTTHCVKLMTNSFKIIPMKFSKFFLNILFFICQKWQNRYIISTLFQIASECIYYVQSKVIKIVRGEPHPHLFIGALHHWLRLNWSWLPFGCRTGFFYTYLPQRGIYVHGSLQIGVVKT